MAGGCGRGQPQLLLPEALGLLNGIQQLLFQLFVALVWWEIQAVETVGRGEQYSQHGQVRALIVRPRLAKGITRVHTSETRPQCQPAGEMPIHGPQGPCSVRP